MICLQNKHAKARFNPSVLYTCLTWKPENEGNFRLILCDNKSPNSLNRDPQNSKEEKSRMEFHPWSNYYKDKNTISSHHLSLWDSKKGEDIGWRW